MDNEDEARSVRINDHRFSRAGQIRTYEEEPLLVKAEQGARMLGVGRATFYSMMAAGILPTVRIGRAVRVPLKGLREWVEKQSGNAAA